MLVPAAVEGWALPFAALTLTSPSDVISRLLGGASGDLDGSYCTVADSLQLMFVAGVTTDWRASAAEAVSSLGVSGEAHAVS